MKKLWVILLALLISHCTLAQQKDLKLSLSTGIYTSIYDADVIPGMSYAFDMSYYITEKIFLVSHFNYGKYRYYDDVLSNAPEHFLRGDGTNAHAMNIHFGLLIGSTFRILKLVDFYWATGISSYTLIRNFVFQSDENTWVNMQSGWTDLAFPARIGIEVHPWEKITMGIVSGFYGVPGFSIVGLHVGPVFSYTL